MRNNLSIRLKLVAMLTWVIILTFIVSIGVDIFNGIFFREKIDFSDTTIALFGAFISRWIISITSYFGLEEKEDNMQNSLKLMEANSKKGTVPNNTQETEL